MYQSFYLYLSASWKFGDSSVQLACNCYWLPWPTAIICFYIFPFPKNEFLSHPFETQGRPGRLSSVHPQLCLTLGNPMSHSTPGLPVYHQLLESIQTHVHWVGDAIQWSHLLSSTSPPALNLSQHQGLFKWVSSLHEVAKVLEFQFQHQSFQWIPRTDLLWDGLVGSPCCPRDSQESSPTPQFKSINSSVLSLLYSPTLTSIHGHWKNHSLD